jgi:hypothetical protein
MKAKPFIDGPNACTVGPVRAPRATRSRALVRAVTACVAIAAARHSSSARAKNDSDGGRVSGHRRDRAKGELGKSTSGYRP